MTATPRYAWSIPGFPVERPSGDPQQPEIWCYTDDFAYSPGDPIDLHVHTTADTYDVSVLLDGARPREVFRAEGLAGQAHETPDDAYAVGCGWPVALTIETDGWESGFYLIVVGMERDGRRYEGEHFAVVRRAADAEQAPIALVLTTSTLLAYNDWGGANHYRGLGDDPYTDIPTPLSAVRRPVARGMLRKPDTAPRSANPHTPEPGELPRHPAYEWAMVHGFSRHHADAFWATYERHFVVWAQEHGYRLDYLTQHDLHHDPAALDGYRCVVFVGHDEYWSREMRDVVDAYVDGGGRVARFGGNFVWQVRFEDDGHTQACYKDPGLDPLRDSDPTLVTTAWDAPGLQRPPGSTFGLSGLSGCYIRYGSAASRASGGFTIYRPNHWSLADTDLGYGDVFGAAPVCVAAFEVDGADFTMHRGLPVATGSDGAPDNLEIVAMAPATRGEIDRWSGTVPLGAPVAEWSGLVEAMFGQDVPDRFQGENYGSGMIASFTRGDGEVFCAGTTEWVNGLRLRDPYTEAITHTVLRRYAGRPGEEGDGQ